jgi:hypothetical protein
MSKHVTSVVFVTMQASAYISAGSSLDSGTGDPAADVVLPSDAAAAAPVAVDNGGTPAAAGACGAEAPVLPLVPFEACLNKFFAAEVGSGQEAQEASAHTGALSWHLQCCCCHRVRSVLGQLLQAVVMSRHKLPQPSACMADWLMSQQDPSSPCRAHGHHRTAGSSSSLSAVCLLLPHGCGFSSGPRQL